MDRQPIALTYANDRCFGIALLDIAEPVAILPDGKRDLGLLDLAGQMAERRRARTAGMLVRGARIPILRSAGEASTSGSTAAQKIA